MSDTDTTATLPFDGFAGLPRYRVIYGATDEHGVQLFAEIRSNLSGAHLTVLDQMFEEGSRVTFGDWWAFIAPFVVAWNVTEDVVVTRTIPAEMAADGETEVTPAREVPDVEKRILPPPAEAGAEVFRRVELGIKLWITSELRRAPRILGADAVKPSARSVSAPAGKPSEPPRTAPEPPSTPKKNRSSRKTSGASSAKAAASISPR